AAKIGVSGRVDDVDFHAAVEDGRVLGEDGDAALAFEIVGVHDALGDGLVVAEGAALAEHGVDQRGLAVVDVGDDSDVADARVQIENSSEFQQLSGKSGTRPPQQAKTGL